MGRVRGWVVLHSLTRLDRKIRLHRNALACLYFFEPITIILGGAKPRML